MKNLIIILAVNSQKVLPLHIIVNKVFLNVYIECFRSCGNRISEIKNGSPGSGNGKMDTIHTFPGSGNGKIDAFHRFPGSGSG
jgi:hypothetical protein